MCLIVLALRCDPRYDLLLGANRDEFHDRASLPAGFWSDAPQVLGGRDLKAGGTWLGVTREGRFAAVTNYRDPGAQRADARSRGELAASFLAGVQSASEFAGGAHALKSAYNPFNLIVGDRSDCWFVGAREKTPILLAPGLHGLSNATLDTPWPKVERSLGALTEAISAGAPETVLLESLSDRNRAPDEALPDTGVGLELERLLSPPFIVGDRYGTRASTVLALRKDGSIHFIEQGFGPGGASGERREFEL